MEINSARSRTLSTRTWGTWFLMVLEVVLSGFRASRVSLYYVKLFLG